MLQNANTTPKAKFYYGTPTFLLRKGLQSNKKKWNSNLFNDSKLTKSTLAICGAIRQTQFSDTWLIIWTSGVCRVRIQATFGWSSNTSMWRIRNTIPRNAAKSWRTGTDRIRQACCAYSVRTTRIGYGTWVVTGVRTPFSCWYKDNRCKGCGRHCVDIIKIIKIRGWRTWSKLRWNLKCRKKDSSEKMKKFEGFSTDIFFWFCKRLWKHQNLFPS